MPRQLTAIMFADLVGYTALMQEDERRAKLLRDRQREVLEQRVAEFEGEILQYYGDGALCGFQSAIQAVECGIAVQVDLREEPPVPVRIGIHLGDVAFDKTGVYGDGVNVASRIESLSVAGGVLVSGKVADEVKNQPEISTQFLSEVALKNVQEPQRVFAVTNSDLAVPGPKEMKGWPKPGRRSGAGGRGWVKWAAGVVVVAGLAGAYALATGGDGSEPRELNSTSSLLTERSIAILPFVYNGPDEFKYLGPGAATQLSMPLTSGVFMPVDQMSIPGYLDNLGPNHPRNQEFREGVATRFDADLVLDGTVTHSGGFLTVEAQLYAPLEETDPLLTEYAQGSTDESHAVFKDLARKLLLRGSGVDTTLVVEAMTESDEALDFWVQGDQQYRSGNYPLAVDLLKTATERDPGFALAHYRLSQAAVWAWEFPLARNSAERARSRGSNLSDWHWRLVDAWHDFLGPRPDQAERTFGQLITPIETVEVTSGIGEVNVHYNLLRGLPTTDAEGWFNRALALDPNYGEVRFHLLEFAARAGDVVRFDSLERGVDPASEQALAWAAVRAFGWGTESDRLSALEDLANAGEREVELAASRVAAFLHDFDGAQEIAELLTRAGRPRTYQEGMPAFLGMMKVAGGQWESAKDNLHLVRQVEREWALEMEGLVSTFPLFEESESDLRALRQEIQDWNPADSTHMPRIVYLFGAHHGVHKILRSYVLSLLSLTIGEFHEAETHREDIRASARSDEDLAFAGALRESINARLALARGDSTAALGILEGVEYYPYLELIPTSPFYSRALDRWLRAELYAKQAREPDALRWYETLTDGLYEFLFAAPAHLRQAEIYASLDSTAAAIHHYDEFIRLWGGADEELQHLVLEARSAKEDLESGGG
ncbi:MAG: hypothetical protein HKO65_17170 [Gemmatimonadetes bacterium]|nr:hypothetical protein [Gemmatimonadota bacterium]